MGIWYAKEYGGYARDSKEAFENARSIWGVVKSYGGTLQATCGMLGNMGSESAYNPWRWQGDVIGSPSSGMGYGLFQFTPAGKYINSGVAQSNSSYAPNYLGHRGQAVDGESQIRFTIDTEGYYATNAYPLSFREFLTSTAQPSYLASAWLYNYERPANPAATEAQRRSDANWWYERLTGETPDFPDGGGTTLDTDLLVLLMLKKMTERRF